MYAIHFICGYIAIIAHIKVMSINDMSMAASMLFFRPNCIGVNIRLKIIFNIKGRAIINDICFWTNAIKTFPNDIAMSI